LNWTTILQQAGIPEPPGYRKTVDAIKADQALYPRMPKVKGASRKSRNTRPKRNASKTID
jgi:hypothetical protein